MRKLLAVVVLLCGAVSADAAEPQKWCSEGFDKPAVITADYRVIIGGVTQNEAQDMDPQRADITILGEGDDESDPGSTAYDKQEVLIFRDRVFWPCSNERP
jgi:hypothetical protein